MSGSGTPCIQARIRRTLHGAPVLTRRLQAARALLRFGPWHHAARAIIRRQRPPRQGGDGGTLVVGQWDSSLLIAALREHGVALAGHLPLNILGPIREVTDTVAPGEYCEFHVVPEVDALVRSTGVLSVAREYLGAEPELLECNLVVAHSEDPASVKISPQRRFHFDYAGWHSLNLFVYLTEVEADSGAHQVVTGTHRGRTLRDAVRPWVPDEEIAARYAGRVRTLMGPAGTLFFEDTAALHRRLVLRRRRVMLNILYASHRSWLSRGRLVPKYADCLHGRRS